VRIDLIIFDLDGTLIDSLGDLADSMNATLASMGFPTHPQEPYRRFVGDGMVTFARRALPADAVEEVTVDEAVRRMRQEYARRWTDTTRPYPGVSELLAGLEKRGLKTVVLSNKPDSATRELVKALLGGHRFQRVLGARPEVPLKPDPTAALEICRALGVLPPMTLFLGDTDIDVETGRRAGMVTVGVTWGFRDADELRDAGAHHIIDHPLDLLELLR